MHEATCVPPRQYELSGHTPHTRLELFVQGAICNMPWSQDGVQACLKVPPVQYDSSGHAEHTLLVVATHAVVSYFSARHVGEQLAL